MDARYDFLSPRGQHTANYLAAYEAHEQNLAEISQYYAALVQFAESESGKILLRNWTGRAFARQWATNEPALLLEVGQFLFLQNLMYELRHAVEWRDNPSAVRPQRVG